MFCDSYGNISLRNLASLMLDVSIDQANILEENIDMTKYRWIVYQWDIDLISPIRNGYDIKITTLPTHMNKFYAYRDFFVEKDGKILARAKATLMLVDLAKMRPIKIPEDLEKAYGKEEAIYLVEKATYEKNLDYIKDLEIRKADLDSNFHVNNAVYFDLIKEITGIDDGDIKNINLVYRNEIRNKEFVRGFSQKFEKEIDFSLKSVEDGSIYCLGKIKTYV